MACAFGANMMMLCYGLVVPSSGFLIPQLEDPKLGFGITTEEGSWLGNLIFISIVIIIGPNPISLQQVLWWLEA